MQNLLKSEHIKGEYLFLCKGIHIIYLCKSIVIADLYKSISTTDLY